MRRFLVPLLAVLLARPESLSAAEIVALGASLTLGVGRGHNSQGVDPNYAYPAQLERLLRSRGCAVQVLNAGIAGDTTDGMLARLPGLISSDTKVLIFQPGSNDALPGNNASYRPANIKTINQYAAEHGVQVIPLQHVGSLAEGHWAGPGHPDEVGHAAIANWLLPLVLRTSVCKKHKQAALGN
jgi:acyl-CoA thioesterase I